MPEFPYGECECRSCNNHEDRNGEYKPGPAAYGVTREGKKMRVCTRCDISSDKDKVCLVNKMDAIEPFVLWDGLGTIGLLICIEPKETDEPTGLPPG